MSFDAHVCPSDEASGRNRPERTSLREKIGSAVGKWRSPLRAMAVALGVSASAYMSPAMAQFSCESVYATDRDGKVFLVEEDGKAPELFDLSINWGNPFGISAGGEIGYIGRQKTSAGEPTDRGGQVIVFDYQSQTILRTTDPALAQPDMRDFVAGSVNLVNGWFYMAAPNGNLSKSQPHQDGLNCSHDHPTQRLKVRPLCPSRAQSPA